MAPPQRPAAVILAFRRPTRKPMFVSRRLALLTIGAALLSACRSRSRTSNRGSLVRRIVSLTPNTTEALFAIGAGALVVGRSRYCDWPPEARSLPTVGGYVDASLEAILALQPDLVVGARGPAGSTLTERLDRRGIDTFFPVTESIVGIEAMIAALADRTGRAAQGARVLEAIDGELAHVRSAVEPLSRPRVLLVFGLAPIVAAAPGSFPDEMLTRAGASNVLQQGPHYPCLGIETVLGLQPDVIVDAAVAEGHGVERISADRPGWSDVQAVKMGRVIAVDDNAVLRPGPRVALGVTRLASLLHPEVQDR
jgi:iron complex transport system substrate-binding protein